MKLLKHLFDSKKQAPLDPGEVRLVCESFAQIQPRSEEVGATIFNQLFTLCPEIRGLFKGDQEAQQRKLMEMLSVLVSSRDNLETLIPIVKELGRRHAKYGVQDEYFSYVGAALLNTLEEHLKGEWNDELRNAWISTYTLLAVTMKAEFKTSRTHRRKLNQ